jgi:hypothetical protein
MFDRMHVVPKETPTTPRLNERGLLGVPNLRVAGDCDLDTALPFLDVSLGFGLVAPELSILLSS